MSRSHRLGSGSPCRGLCSTTPSLALTNLPANLRNHRRNCTDRPVPPARWAAAAVRLEGSRRGGCGSTTPSWRWPKCSQDQLVRWVLAALWEAEELAESVVESAAEWAGVLEMVWVDWWVGAQGELWCCSPFPSSSSRTPVGLETKWSPTVRSQIRSRMVATSLTLTKATEEVGSGATSSKDSTS